MLRLLGTRRFGPLFATQFLGAFNDNLYKTAMLFLITYQLLAHDVQAGAVMVQLAAGVFILPFVLFSGIAGQVADGVDKARVVRWVKTAEVLIMAVGAVALEIGSIPLLMVVLFGMGCHSTLFGPIKYAILPQHLGRDEVLGGTGLVEAGTYVAILTGQVAGGLMGSHAAWGIVAVAFVGWLTGRAVPSAPPRHEPRIDWNVVRASWTSVKHLLDDRRMWMAVLAISWFWSMGAVFTAEFVPLVKGRLYASEQVATLFLAMFSIGVSIGSLAVNRLLHGRVSAKFAPAALIAISLFVVDLVLAAHHFRPGPEVLGARAFLMTPGSWHILLSLLGLSASAGVFVVPLYAMLQTIGDPGERAQIIAANNIVNSGFMVVASLGGAAIVAAGRSVLDVLLVVGALNLAVLPYAIKLQRASRA